MRWGWTPDETGMSDDEDDTILQREDEPPLTCGTCGAEIAPSDDWCYICGEDL